MQKAKTRYCICVVLCLAAFEGIVPRLAAAITLHKPGYFASAYATLPAGGVAPSDIQIDAAGNLYVPTYPNGIRQVNPAGIVTPWSVASSMHITLTSNGDGYGAGGPYLADILRIESDGSYSTLNNNGYVWAYPALSPDGRLYAIVNIPFANRGVYEIDRSTGQATVIVAGGPYPGGDGSYDELTLGYDGKLYTLSTSAGMAKNVLRLDGQQFTQIATLPNGGIGLSRGPEQMLYCTATYSAYPGSAHDLGEVWAIDVALGTTSLFVSGVETAGAIGYDAYTGRLYFAEQVGPGGYMDPVQTRQVWVITSDSPVPAQRSTFGALKAKYRGAPGAAQPGTDR